MDEMGENVIEGFMRTRRLLDEALVYADTATRLGDVAAVDPELARMTRAQLVAFVSPVLAHREFVTTAVYGAADDALLGSLLGSLLDTLTLAYTALHPVATDERSGRFTRSPRCAASSTSGHSAPGLRWTA